MRRFLTQWLAASIALGGAAFILPGVRIGGALPLIFGALALGFINAVVRPVLQIVSIPLTVMTLGLFYFVVNGIAFALAAAVVPGFHVDTCSGAILAPVIVAAVSWLIGVSNDHDHD
jgi:putative membrane protein